MLRTYILSTYSAWLLFCRAGCVEYFGSLMKAGAVKCVAVADEVGPGFCDYSFDRSHFKLFKKDGSEMVDGK